MNGLHIGFIVFFIILVLFLIIFILIRNVFIFPSEFGTWTLSRTSPCVEGEQVVYQICQLNPQTGLGCLVDNVQYFGIRILERRSC